MGLSYNIIPTNEMGEKEAYLEHFKTIETYEFPDNFDIDTNSRYPKLIKIESILFKSGCLIIDETEEKKKDEIISRSYQLNHEYTTDFTIHYIKEEIITMTGIHGDFNILLRIATQLTKICGTMIIWSAYDAHYVEKGKIYEEIWNEIKSNWTSNE